jgi:oxygen-independent coproporphyrinogen-3 oxidase
MTTLVATGSIADDFQADLQLARKYACQGPRYTSYPTAPQFTSDFPVEDYIAWQRQSADNKTAPLSLYLHLPFCHDICYYCGCNKVVSREAGIARRYLDYLAREIQLQAPLVGDQRPITQMHWGGGTPTYLDNAEITELMHLLASHFKLLDTSDREYSIEIDPRTIDPATVALLKGIGFNRISMGIQDFDPAVQKAINRIQPYRDVAALVESVRAHSYRSLSFDLIYGLPHQNRASMTTTLNKVIQLRPDRIACYNYAHLPERFKSQRAIDRLTLPTPEEKLVLQQLISTTLQEAGYRFIGMDHYVLPEDELAVAQREGKLQRNFQGYSLQMADDLLGIGASAISQLGDYYLQNAPQLDDYYQRLESGELPISKGYRMRGDDHLRRHIIMSLISELHLDVAACNQHFNIDFHQLFAAELALLEPMIADELLCVTPDTIQIHERGRPFLRNICMPFDAYLPQQQRADGPRFSATL